MRLWCRCLGRARAQGWCAVSTYKVKIRQTYKVTREITLNVDAPSPEVAADRVASGEINTPDFDNAAWRTGWDLQGETVEVCPVNPRAWVTHS
jgi:hypothetical protein